MSKTFHCELVTPAEKLFDEPVAHAVVPAWDGLFGVLPGRAPLLARLGLGELTVRHADGDAAGGTRSYFIDGGFVKMAGEKLTILAERAVPAERINEADAKAELAEAEARTVPADAADRGAETDRINHERRAARTKLTIAQQAKARGI
ncbi:MAG: F0F1 ATP synthase subunit epsilon [Planctomycetota bacterium]